MFHDSGPQNITYESTALGMDLCTTSISYGTCNFQAPDERNLSTDEYEILPHKHAHQCNAMLRATVLCKVKLAILDPHKI
jgi:hypothetical protein